ncbi:MAG: selenium-dependent xanthine dehydrogenase [Elusimicrobia bacterium]|nr:selenium-dependent xanthine dehydrogenase [Elusimicrobiota bacterium]
MSVIRFTLNGRAREFRGAPKLSLLRYLRDEAELTSVKDGCSPQAACGCCTVELGGKAVLSCVTEMSRVEGAEVRTVEGLEPRAQEAFVDAFKSCGGVQCGFCIPGILLRARNLLRRVAAPTREEAARALNQHLCRCTGYKKILDAILAAGRALRGQAPPPPTREGRVGVRLPKQGLDDLVLGRKRYVADLSAPGMLHAALRLSDHPRAVVKRLDASAALAREGVLRVLVAQDVPGRRLHGLIVQDWPLLVAEGETTRYDGDVLAVAVATTREAAREAARSIRVDYEALEPVVDPAQALAASAPALHPKGNRLGASRAVKGDAEAAFKRCAHVVEGVYATQRIEHGFLETEACLAVPEPGGLTVYSQGQGVYEDRRQLAAILGVPERAVNVVLVPCGGGFGGKEDLLIQGHAALAAQLLRAPVKLELTRDESIRMHPKRHPLRMEYRLGCDADGKLLALRARILGDTGAYASVGMKVLERAAGHATGGYHVPNVDVEAVAAYTNNVPCGAMRGFGANQATFAMESAVDELCSLGGFDRWRFRYDNALTDGSTTATGQALAGGVGVRACLEAVRDAFRSARYAGLACGIKNTGIGNGMPDASEVEIAVLAPDRVEIHHGWTEMGQGVDTVAVQVVCQETGLDPAIVHVRVRTEDAAPSGMTTASRATSLVGNALIDACQRLKDELQARPLADLVGRRYRGRWTCDWTNKPGHPADGKPEVTHYSYSYAAQVAILDDAGRVAKLVAAHDAGRVINPTLFEGQIEGALHMGLGYALTEALPSKGGRLESTRLRDCGILRAREMPEVEVLAVEVADPFGPYGAKGVGEIGLVPTAAAVANALYAFDGIRRRTLPMSRKP